MSIDPRRSDLIWEESDLGVGYYQSQKLECGMRMAGQYSILSDECCLVALGNCFQLFEPEPLKEMTTNKQE